MSRRSMEKRRIGRAAFDPLNYTPRGIIPLWVGPPRTGCPRPKTAKPAAFAMECGG